MACGAEVSTVTSRHRLASPPQQAFSIAKVLARILTAVKPFAPAALFQLAQEGYTSPFEQLIACILSIRTRDETTVAAAMRLFALARNPKQLSRLTADEIDARIRDCTFHHGKARQILAIAKRVATDFAGTLPCDRDVLLSLHGVGVKCANLVLGIACDQPAVAVDIHVHRVTNRWGYVAANTPEQTMAALQLKLPKRYWVEINRLLVPFGKHICTWRLPRCSTCPVRQMCRQVGVTSHR